MLLCKLLPQATMLLWTSLLISGLVRGHLRVPRSVISIQPPWTTVFQGESVNLSCDDFLLKAPEKTTWFHQYQRKETQTDTAENTLKVLKSGSYRCQTPGSLPSNPVLLQFSAGLFILQTPQAVFEGDTLTLRCRKKEDREKVTAVQYLRNGRVVFSSNESLDLVIPQASLNHSGSYQCIGTLEKTQKSRSNQRFIHIQELFPRPQLQATSAQPVEGSTVTLSCVTRLPQERQGTRLRFLFLRDDGVVLSDWSGSPEFQITDIWGKDSGAYWCAAETETASVRKRGLPLQMRVQRVPVSGALLQTQPSGDQAVEGLLVLNCSVTEGTGYITFSWHREGTGETLGSKRQRSPSAELETPVTGESQAGGYYCTADNGHGLVQSPVLNVTVRGTPGTRSDLIAAGTSVGLLIFLLLALPLLFYRWHSREPGARFLGEMSRHRASGDERKSLPSVCLAPLELQLISSNAHSKEEDLTYSEVQIVQLEDISQGDNFRMHPEDTQPSVIYSEVKTPVPDDLSGRGRAEDEETMGIYKNLPLF